MASLPDNGKHNQAKKRRIIIVVSITVGYIILIGLLAVIYQNKLAELAADPDRFREWIDSYGYFAKLVYVLLCALQVMLAVIHDGPMQIAGGFAFGPVGGTLLFLLGFELGSVISFLLARRFGRVVVGLFYSEERYERFFSKIKGRNLYILTFLLYLVPGTPKDMMNYCFGTTKIKLAYFLLISGVARAPAVLLTIMIAQNVVDRNVLMVLIIISVLALLYFVGVLVRKIIRNRK